MTKNNLKISINLLLGPLSMVAYVIVSVYGFIFLYKHMNDIANNINIAEIALIMLTSLFLYKIMNEKTSQLIEMDDFNTENFQ